MPSFERSPTLAWQTLAMFPGSQAPQGSATIQADEGSQAMLDPEVPIWLNGRVKAPSKSPEMGFCATIKLRMNSFSVHKLQVTAGLAKKYIYIVKGS